MRFEKIKKFILLLMCFLSTSSIFALEEYVSDVYKKIDTVFTVKSEPQLYDVLETNKNDKYYYLIENYTMKKIRRLIVNNDYDFADLIIDTANYNPEEITSLIIEELEKRGL